MNKYVSVSIIALLFLSTIYFIQIKSVQATTTYLSDTFESFSTGWTTGSGSGGLIAKSGEQYHGGSYSAVVNSTVVANYGYAYKTVTSTPKSDYHIDEWVYPSSAVSAINLFLGGCYNTTTSNYNFIMGLNCSGGVFYLVNCLVDAVPGTWENVGSMSNDSWHHIEAYFIKSSTKIHYYIDSVKQGGDWASLNNVFPERFYFGDTSATARMGKCFYDDLSVDNITEPLPADTEAPKYSSIGYNSTVADTLCKFSSLWTDNVSLSGYIFGTNNTETFTNETWTAFGSSNSSWANVTKTLIANIATIQFCWWSNDSSNNWNNTGMQYFNTTGRSVTFYIDYFGSGSSVGFINYNGTLICNLGEGLNGTSMAFSNATTTLRLEAFNGPSNYGNIFEWFYINGTKISTSDPTPSKSGNPYNLLVNNSYVVIANFTQRQNACANFTISPQTAGINDTITFDPSLSYIIDRTITLYTWDFGDGNISTTNDLHPSIIHKYATTNLFNVTLTISDIPYSDTDSLIKSISITEDTSWYIAPGFILGFVCFLGVGFVFIKKRKD